MPPVPRTPTDRARDALATALDTAASEAVPPERFNARVLALAHQTEIAAYSQSDQDLRRQLAAAQSDADTNRRNLDDLRTLFARVRDERDELLAKIGAPAGSTPDQVLGLLARLDAAVKRLEAIPPR
jgi:chromosome segregation ATPase